MISDNQAGIPIHMESLDGNSADKTTFHNTVHNFIKQLQNTHDFEYLVMDSAGYTSKTINECGDEVKWISRVPHVINEAKALITLDKSLFTPLSEGYSYMPKTITYGGVEQRWLVVFSKKAYAREIKTFQKNYSKRVKEEEKRFTKLCKQSFSCLDDAIQVLNKFNNSCKYTFIENEIYDKKGVFKGKGRPFKGALPDSWEYRISGTVTYLIEPHQKEQDEKGKFIIATNELITDKLTDKEVFNSYKGQAQVEKGFRFLKDPQFIASSLFVKKPERIDALLFIMTLTLTIYAAIEYRIRQKLEDNSATIPNQIGKPINNPTARWVFCLFNGVHLLYGMNTVMVLNINNTQKQIIKLLGAHYYKYYFLE